MIVDNEEVYPNYRRSCHGTKVMKSAFNVMGFEWENNSVIWSNYKSKYGIEP